jgi:hypothetical protein
VVMVDRGYDNLVILIDRLYAVRVPRNENAYLRSQYEKLVLEQLGEDVAQFAYHMHTAFSVEEALKMRIRIRLDELAEEPWDIHMRKTLSGYTFPTAAQDAAAKEYYDKWRKLAGPLVVVHDELQVPDMRCSVAGSCSLNYETCIYGDRSLAVRKDQQGIDIQLAQVWAGVG